MHVQALPAAWAPRCPCGCPVRNTAAIAQKESLEAQLAALQKEHNALLNERSNLRNQVSDLRWQVRAAGLGAEDTAFALALMPALLQARAASVGSQTVDCRDHQTPRQPCSGLQNAVGLLLD